MFKCAIGQVVRLASVLLMVAAIGCPALASPPVNSCFAVRPADAGDQPPSLINCAGTPAGYEQATLWLRLPMRSPPNHLALLVHTTRFDQLKAIFAFSDGSREIQEVRRGAFGDHWRIGGQIEFQPRWRTAPLTSVWLKIDRLQSYGLLRVRLVPAGVVSHQFELCAALVGAAVALLAVTALYNFALAVAVRRRLFLWHGLWATMMVCWGVVWSQGALFAFPQIAGTSTSQLATVLACLAVLLASLSAISVLKGVFASQIRRAITGAAIAVVILGGWSAVPGADLAMIGTGLTILTLSILAAIGSGLVIGHRRGESDASDLLIAWVVPMMVLGATQVFDFNTSLFGGGAQIAVLFASAFQAICLSALATRRLGVLRSERDAAIASEAALAEVAERDALTGLLNRRGFVRRCEQAFGDLHHIPFGLLLIDVDRFKRINDQFGHEVGDAVLVRLSTRLRAFEDRYACLAGRLGGEEFLIGVSGIPADALERFADHVRAEIGTSDDDIHPGVTVSIGVAHGTASGPFVALYGNADRALYEAKASGRNRVVLKEAS
ncbi:diguanylate cyclase domain-containing protein [Sphingomonas sp. NPDC079357]|uniref:GGDEF domain-containing protein n=1 Tax=Sphingomonas sp. NPDC079357 TaxID=3364518 RepID=UPI00384A98F5